MHFSIKAQSWAELRSRVDLNAPDPQIFYPPWSRN